MRANFIVTLGLCAALGPLACAGDNAVTSPARAALDAHAVRGTTPIAADATDASPAMAGGSEADLPPPTVVAAPCQLDQLRDNYQRGRWKECERSAQICLQKNPLQTEARLLLVRIYLMRAYAAKEPRWLDEARRQLKMSVTDPASTREAQDLLLLVDAPLVDNQGLPSSDATSSGDAATQLRR